MSVAEAVAGAVSGLGNVGIGIYNAYQQAQNYKYQKNLQKQIFSREDSAIQRQVADAQAAGYNKFAVMGNNGAGAGSVVSTTAPQIDSGMAGSAVDAMSAMYQLGVQKNSAKIAEANAKKAVAEKNIAENAENESNWNTALNVANSMALAGYLPNIEIGLDSKPITFNKSVQWSDGNRAMSYSHPDFNSSPIGQMFNLDLQNVRNQASILNTDEKYKELNTVVRMLGQIMGAGQSAGSSYRSFRRK